MGDAAESVDAGSGSGAIEDFVSSLGIFDDIPRAERPAPTNGQQQAKQEPGAAPVKKPEPEDDLADLLDDSKPWTQERAIEVKGRLDAARAKAREAKRTADNAYARARSQEERFGRTKEKVLNDKRSVEAEKALLDGYRRALTSGDKAMALQAIGHMMGKDGLSAWEEISLAVAAGKAGKKVDPELQSRLDRMEQLLQQALERPVQMRQQESDQQTFERVTQELVLAAATPETAQNFPLVARFATKMQADAKFALTQIKQQEYERTQKPIDNSTAFGILEARLKAHSQLYQEDHAPDGQATVERGTAGSEPVGHAAPRPEAANQAPSPPPRTTIPANLSGRSGGSHRPATEAERLREVARQIPAQTFRDMGLGGLLLDGEE